MAHTDSNKPKLLNRVRRIRGQLDGIERGLEAGQDCTKILQTIAACRGAINGLMLEVIEGHIRHHVVNPDIDPASEESQAAQDVIDVLRRYLK